MAAVLPGIVDLGQELIEVDPSPEDSRWRDVHGNRGEVFPDAVKFFSDRSEILMVEGVVHWVGGGAGVVLL